MQPRDEDMRPHAAGEVEQADGGVCNLAVEVVAALGLDGFWHFAEQAKDNGNIMRRERPEDILLPPQLAQVEPVGVDVLDAAQPARVNQLLQLQHCRMIPEQMADHENAALLFGQRDQLRALLLAQAERLFNIHILASQQCLPRQQRM